MNSFKIDGKLGSFIVNLPENVEEISKEYLDKCTEHVHPAPDYALVGVVYKDSLALVLTAAKKNKPANIPIVPLFIKAGKSDSEFINSLTLGDKVVIAGSDLSLGHHIKCPNNKITPDNVINVCEGDKNIYQQALLNQKPVCFLEFKLVPVCTIHAQLNNAKVSFNNPYIFKAPADITEN